MIVSSASRTSRTPTADRFLARAPESSEMGAQEIPVSADISASDSLVPTHISP